MQHQKALHRDVCDEAIWSHTHGVPLTTNKANAQNLSEDIFARMTQELNAFIAGDHTKTIDFSPQAISRGANFQTQSLGTSRRLNLAGEDEMGERSSTTTAGGGASARPDHYADDGGGRADPSSLRDGADEQELEETRALARTIDEMIAPPATAVERLDPASDGFEGVDPHKMPVEGTEEQIFPSPRPLRKEAEAKHSEFYRAMKEAFGPEKKAKVDLPLSVWHTILRMPQMISDYNLHNIGKAVTQLVKSLKEQARGHRTCQDEFFQFLVTNIRAGWATCNLTVVADSDGEVKSLRDALLATNAPADQTAIILASLGSKSKYEPKTFQVLADAVEWLAYKVGDRVVSLTAFFHTPLQRFWMENIPGFQDLVIFDETYNASRIDFHLGALVGYDPISGKYLEKAYYLCALDKGKDQNDREAQIWAFSQWAAFGYEHARVLKSDCNDATFNAMSRIVIAETIRGAHLAATETAPLCDEINKQGDAAKRREGANELLLSLAAGKIFTDAEVDELAVKHGCPEDYGAAAPLSSASNAPAACSAAGI
jgi:hypothetical protein